MVCFLDAALSNVRLTYAKIPFHKKDYILQGQIYRITAFLESARVSAVRSYGEEFLIEIFIETAVF